MILNQTLDHGGRQRQIAVLHVIVGLGRGGAEMMLMRLIQEPSTQPFVKQSVVSLTGVGECGIALRQAGYDVHELKMRKSFLGFLSAMRRLTHHMVLTKPDIVQTWMVHSDLMGSIAALLARVPRIIWGVRTTDYSVESPATRVVRWVCARVSSIVPDRIVCAASASLNSSLAAGYDKTRLMVIPNGFDIDTLSQSIGKGVQIRTEASWKTSDIVVGCLGRYNPAKDYENFVRASALLAAKYQNMYFLMVGRGLEGNNQVLNSLILSTGYPERFTLLGERTDPGSCIDAMDIYVLSSRTEGFPNALAEAMAMGKPCVTTNVGDAAYLVGDTAEVVEPRDASALAAAVSRLANLSPIEREILGANAKKRLATSFSIKASASLFANLYEELATDLR